MPITISVSGTCSENVFIGSDHVTLVTTSGSTIDGPDATRATILVRADGVVINGFTVTGGSVGIAATGSQRLTVENCTVENTGHIGLVFQQGAAGTINNCTIQNNPHDGMLIYNSNPAVTVTNSVISGNSGAGIHVCCGGSATIGIDLNGHLAGNQITNNTGAGILIAESGSALIGGNTITGNGNPTNGVLGQDGISIFEAAADIAGGNTISNNNQCGISLRASRLFVGDPSTGFTSGNTISHNGVCGISNSLGSIVTLFDADVSNNTGSGLRAGIHSTTDIANTTINNNSGDGISLIRGAGLFLEFFPQVTVTGNNGFGLHCFDAESKVAGSTAGITANSGGNISPGCTGF